jgi:hypothetical protein
MKISRVILLVVVLIVVLIIAAAALAALNAPKNSEWKVAAEYPIQAEDTSGVSGQQCVNSTVYIYCIGGADVAGGPHNTVYTSSAISSSFGNITGWTQDVSPYPQTIFAQACVANSGYVYCTGGTYDDAGDDVASSYYAPLTSNGVVGTWSPTTPYPIPVDSQSCVTSSGYIYCVGGWDEAAGTNASRALSNYVYYAPLSPSGIGDWTQTASYPSNTYFPSCYATDGYIYCIGGVDSNENYQSLDYYASLSATGVGSWIQTMAYPFQGLGQGCATSSGYIYCVGGDQSSGFTNAVYYATVSSGGIGAWVKAPNYPDSVWTNCAILSSNMYCVGGLDGSSTGETGASYYIPLISLTSTTTTS